MVGDGTDNSSYPNSPLSHSPINTNHYSYENSVSSSSPKPKRDDLLQLLLEVNESTSIKETENCQQQYQTERKNTPTLSTSTDSNDLIKLSRIEIRDHLLEFIIHGSECITSAVLWILYELSIHKDWQKKCQEEVDRILSTTGNRLYNMNSDSNMSSRRTIFQFDDINNCELLFQVMNECFRLHPIIPLLSYHSTTECPIGPYLLRPGMMINISLSALHTHPDYWLFPLDFHPERFSSNNLHQTMKHPFQFLPFSAGGRSCIGHNIAQMQIVAVVATLLSQYSFRLSKRSREDVVIEETLTCRPSNLLVSVIPRFES